MLQDGAAVAGSGEPAVSSAQLFAGAEIRHGASESDRHSGLKSDITVQGSS